MAKRLNFFSLSLVAVLFIIMARVFYLIFTEKFTIGAEDIVGILLLVFGIRLFFVNAVNGEFVLLILIILTLGDLLQVNISIADEGYTTNSYVSIGSLSFHPFTFLLLIFYCLINRDSLTAHIRNLRHGTEDEQKRDYHNKVNFYYKKFKGSSDEEFKKAMSILKEYPEEAQIALQRLEAENVRIIDRAIDADNN